MWTFAPYPDWVIGDIVDVLEATDFHYTPTQVLADFELFCAVGLEMRLRRMARDEVAQARGRHGR